MGGTDTIRPPARHCFSAPMLAAMRRAREWRAKRKCVAVRSQLAANTNCDGTIRDVANIAELPELLRMIMMQGAERRLKVARLSAAH